MNKVWYICDFFVRNKEAVSNQIELLARHSGGTVIAAQRFMGQKALRKAELKDRIIVLPASVYQIVLPFVLLASGRPIHYFEEESSKLKRALFNARKRPLYISMYRRPTPEYAQHLRRYRNLVKVFVELDDHKDILVGNGIRPELVEVSATPAKIGRKRAAKKYDPGSVRIVFASWNNKEKNALHERGIIYLLDLVAKNPHLTLEIPPRDNSLTEFWAEVEKRDIKDRVALLEVKAHDDLVAMYDRADFVAFTCQARVTKDVPNSLIDGLMRGKPILISTAIDFHRVVANHGLGIVIPVGQEAGQFRISEADYKSLSDNAFKYSSRHTPEEYLKVSGHYGGGQ